MVKRWTTQTTSIEERNLFSTQFFFHIRSKLHLNVVFDLRRGHSNSIRFMFVRNELMASNKNSTNQAELITIIMCIPYVKRRKKGAMTANQFFCSDATFCAWEWNSFPNLSLFLLKIIVNTGIKYIQIDEPVEITDSWTNVKQNRTDSSVTDVEVWDVELDLFVLRRCEILIVSICIKLRNHYMICRHLHERFCSRFWRARRAIPHEWNSCIYVVILLLCVCVSFLVALIRRTLAAAQSMSAIIIGPMHDNNYA